MYISDANHNPTITKPPPPSLDFSDDEHHNDMMIEVVPSHHHQPHEPHRPPSSSSGPKKRAETWVQDETRNLISLRRDMDSLFNTSKSNKHLWEQISAKMRDRGFDRSPTMCTDKWRNLLKEFKKAKQQMGNGSNGNRNAKMLCYKEIEEILMERNRCGSTSNAAAGYKSSSHNNSNANDSSKVDPFLQFSDKVIDDASIPFGSVEANGRPTLNLERSLDHEGHPLAITADDAVTAGGCPSSFWQETPGNGDDTHSFGGRVITVKWGDYTRRVGVDGTAEAIKDVIHSAFRLRTKRAFWLEDENQVARSLDRDMPCGTYTLHLDEGMTIKLHHYEESEHIPYPSQTLTHTEEKTFYTEDDFREFMQCRGWSCLRELNSYRNIDNLDDLRPDALYRGVT